MFKFTRLYVLEKKVEWTYWGALINTTFAKYPLENPKRKLMIPNSISDLKMTGRSVLGWSWHIIIMGRNPILRIENIKVHDDDFSGYEIKCFNKFDMIFWQITVRRKQLVPVEVPQTKFFRCNRHMKIRGRRQEQHNTFHSKQKELLQRPPRPLTWGMQLMLQQTPS